MQAASVEQRVEVGDIPGLDREFMTAVQHLLLIALEGEGELLLSYLIWPPGTQPTDVRILAEYVRAAA